MEIIGLAGALERRPCRPVQVAGFHWLSIHGRFPSSQLVDLRQVSHQARKAGVPAIWDLGAAFDHEDAPEPLAASGLPGTLCGRNRENETSLAMLFPSFNPSPALRAVSFNNIDEFRQAFRSVDVEFTPLCRSATADQAILFLPGCEVYLLRTFPRLIDAALREGCTFVGMTMADDFPLRFNGVEKTQPALSLGYSGAGYKVLESEGCYSAALVFNPEIDGRGWPGKDRIFVGCPISAEAEQRIREVVLTAFRFVSTSPAHLSAPGALLGLKETLLSAIDVALCEPTTMEAFKAGTVRRYFDIVQKVERALSDRHGAPVYSMALADEIGVSVRTMHNAMQQFRGMSLHRYLRMKRLWSVRRQLLAGAHKVSACAFANGFWHLGEFAQFYAAQFGETPSQTLARAR